tara:strand:+ start:6884 stop:7663 length:780 start_codon:yes stop_codon:yes gene_type:complete
MRANKISAVIVVVLCSLLTAPSVYASSQKSFKSSSSHKNHSQTKQHSKNEAKANKLKEKLERLAKIKAAKLEKAAAEKARREQPRAGYKINMRESLNHGLIVSAVYQIHNVQLSPEGAASAELEIRDSSDNVLRTEQCSATRELATEIREDNYRLICKISHKNRFSARLQILDAAPGLYSGTGRNTTQIDDVDTYPVGYGAVSLEVVQNQPDAIDCVVSEWTPFSSCFGGSVTRSRTILVEPQNGGAACPALTETVSCL